VAFGKPLSLAAIDGLVSESTRPSGSLNFMKSWWSSPPKRTLPHASTNLGLVRPISPPLPSTVAEPTNATPPVEKKQHFAKSLRMTSDQLKSLNLNPGPNTITFSVTSSLQGIQTCSARIFLWESDSLIVISDIDGTITKYCIFNRRSDVLGHVFNMVGKDWTHNGVASLYSRIANNGFKFLYLSSRAIGQAQSTREYLDKIEQDRQQLPQGPVLLSPDRLIRALTREVVLRKPEEFKIACLRDIKKLFEKNPFFAGFGNRITDALAYRSVDIPISRIYTVDPKGDLKLDLVTFFKSSYTNLKETVDQVFPPNKQMGSYNDFNYWKPEVVTLQISSDSSDSEYENSDEEFDLEHLKDVPY
jgi:phosphatidate phosphatase LPIN